MVDYINNFARNGIKMAEEEKGQPRPSASQLTLDNYDEGEETDPDYGHLTAHLVEAAPKKKDTVQWTRVFTRDEIASLQIAAHLLGPDLLYDRSLREAAQESEDLPGEVVFSPMHFTKQDLSRTLAECEIPHASLLGLAEVATKARQRFTVGSLPLAPAPAAALKEGAGAVAEGRG